MNRHADYLKNLSKTSGTPYTLLCQHYAMERFLYRLGLSQHVNSFYLKGGMLLMGLGFSSARPTLDIDLLGHVSNTPEVLVRIFREILQTKLKVQDGIIFSQNLFAEEITKDSLYVGIRMNFPANVYGEKIPMKVDIGFGDALYPKALDMEYPNMIPGMPCAQIKTYTEESLIAEKWQAMVQLGSFNSRMKDFYDLWMLSREHSFDLATLKEAIRRTFELRKTEWSAYRNLRDVTYCQHQQPEWSAFVRKMKATAFQRKLKIELPSIRFEDILDVLLNWLEPVMETEDRLRWHPKKGWEAY